MSYIGNEPIVSATRTVTEITATAGQTVFTANGGYTVGYLDVFVNGAQQQTSDFTATNGSTVTLNVPTQAGDDIRLVAWGTFNSANLNGAALVNSSVTPDKLSVQSQYTGFKNRIINGDMRIDQRNAGASVSNIDGYGVDRWYGSWTGSSTGRISAQQSSVAPAGFTNSWLLTVTATSTSPATNDGNFVRQRIEGFNTADLGWGTANAQPVTVSFWVRSSVTGTFPLLIANADNTRAFGATFVISSANTWEYKTITVAGDTTGTWVTNNGTGISLVFGLGGGTGRTVSLGWQTTSQTMTTVTGAVNLVATNGATFYITGVQLEKGSTATSFDYRPYGTELALCQRYYQLWRFITRFASANSNQLAGTTLAVPMRANPTLTRTGDSWTISETGTTVSGAFSLDGLVIVVGANSSSSGIGGIGNANAEL